MGKLIKVAAAMTLVGAFQAWGAAETFPLVDGEKQAVIVGDMLTPAYPYEGPKNFLQHYVETSTGRALRTVAEKEFAPATMPYPIFVGRTKRAEELFGEQLKTLGVDDYIVCVKPDFVVLVGATRETTAWAQFDFVREYLGIDCYFPHRLGLVVPRHETVRVPAETRIERPVYKNRGFWAFNAEGKAGRGWCAGAIPWRLPMEQRGPVASHTIQTLVTLKEYGQTHPEYFPMIDGQRKLTDSGSGPGPCISNPEVVQIVIEKVRQYFTKHPREQTFSLGMTDGGFCECPPCQALDGPVLAIRGCERGKPVCRRWFVFLNQVGAAVRESHPGKVITTLAYAGCEVPPAELKLEPNLMPFICWTHSCWFDPAVRQANLAVTDAWLERLDQIGLYEYYYGSSLAIPMIYTHDMADYLRHVARRARNQDTLAIFVEANPSWGMDGPKVWILEKLLWNPEQDVDQLTKRWCDAVFAESAPAMLRYFQELEQLRVKNRARLDNVTQYVPWKGKAEKLDLQNIFGLWQKSCQLRLFPPADVARCQTMLEEARQLAKQGIVRERIDYFASTFKLTEYASKTYHAYARLSEQLWDGAGPDKLFAALVAGDPEASPVDALEYAQQLLASDSTKLHGPTIHLDGCGLAMRKIIHETAGKRIGELLAAGEDDRAKLVGEGQNALLAIVSADARATVAGQKRLATLMSVAARLVTAQRIAAPPAIDGNPDEPLWQWVDQCPWFNWQSAVEDQTPTRFAIAHDGRFLYIALRCSQTDLATQKRCPNKVGAPAYEYPSVEIFLNEEQPGVEANKLSFYQAIPAFGGGFLETGGGKIGDKPGAMAAYAITDAAGEWRAEMKIDLEKVGLSPTNHRWLRLNLVRNLGAGGFSGRTWFPSPAAHKEADSRGWLLFGK